MRVKLKGEVMDNDRAAIYRRWGYTANCCPADVEKAVENCPDGEELTVEISSFGGGVYAGFEMYSALRQHKGRTVAEVYGIAGSAASVVIAACDEVRISPVAQIMIHRASSRAEGNSETMTEAGQMLNAVDESILNAYEEKVKGKTSREELRAYMERETFFTAQQAIERGFADGLLERPAGEKGEIDRINSAVACMREMESAWSKPTLEELMAREAQGIYPLSHGEAVTAPLAYKGSLTTTPRDGERTKQSETSDRGTAEHIENSKEKGSEEMEITNVDQLWEAYPELMAEVSRKATENAEDGIAEAVNLAVTAERERIAGIDSVAVAGFEELIANAKADPNQNAGTVAMAIIKAQKEQGAAYLAGVRKDAAEANGVPMAEPVDKHEETPEEAARAAVKGYFGKKES